VPQILPMAGMAPLGAKIERTPAGEQHVLPGAGRATDATMASRAASAAQGARPAAARRPRPVLGWRGAS
jgi:hypothetical protein